ncbi:CheR family methyltransferase [Nevskia sp.]|uniref:CheR family methyltransferase n=1 Tax=Nevskia sp. TaxID=1929292 RepID=UPI0025DB56AE|nr:CheR family methyltransferase [Nevskia sp.]
METGADDRTTPERDQAPLSLAVIGASAGGVEALCLLIKHFPEVPRFAIVVLTHLDPGHESQLVPVLQKCTAIPVQAMSDGDALEAGRIYVLVPAMTATLLDRKLVLTPRGSGLNLPIDIFLSSAARDSEIDIAAVILSGTGQDGTAGVAEVRDAGGYVVVQEPASATHDGMPQSVLDNQLADAALTPEQIAPAIQRYLESEAPTDPAVLPDAKVLDEVHALIQKQSGLNLRYYKEVNVRRRFMRRAFLQSGGDVGHYLVRLRDDPDEILALKDDLLVGVTAFFRDPEMTEGLRQFVIPALLESNANPIRVWVPGCSTGEEVYSIAILLVDALAAAGVSRKLQIFGTDINERAISRARLGRYSAEAMAAVPETWRAQYFVAEEGGWRLTKDLRSLCIFATHNLLANAPFSGVDLVSCRNLLIYLHKDAKRQAFEAFSYAASNGGSLLLGRSEAADPEFFEDMSTRHNLYRRRPKAPRPVRGFTFTEPLPAGPLGTPSGEKPDFALENLADQLALAHFGPPGFVVDANGRVLQFRGDTSPFLLPSSGDATLSIARLVRPELQVDVRAVLMEAARTKLPVRRDRVFVDGHQYTLEVLPLQAGASQRYFLVALQRRDLTAIAPAASGTPDARTDELEHYIRVLSDELEQSRTQLRAVVTEYDTTSEELRTANEEVLSANEELQSANEELQTAKQELEAANRDLTGVNEEMARRNQELVQLNDDLSNLINGIPVPVLMLDRQRRVRHFSPAAGPMFGLTAADLGGPLAKSSAFAPEMLDAILDDAVQDLRPVEQEAQDLQSRSHIITARAYQTSDNRIEGAVLAFQDIQRLRLALDEANAARAEAERANTAKNEFLALVSHELRAPLNVITGWSAVLQKLSGDGDTATLSNRPTMQRALDIIDRNCRLQARLIDDLLDVSRIISGRLSLDLRLTNLSGLIGATVEGMAPTAEARKIALSADGMDEATMLLADTRRVQQIIANLLQNAIKFTPEGGRIVVSLARVDTWAELTVTDTGMGIPADRLPRIFDRFSQADTSRTREHGGLGLGLSIVRHLAEGHGGTVAAHSEGPDKGARFVVRLPLAPAQMFEEVPAGNSQTPNQSLRGYRILIVDDEVGGREAITHLLNAAGAEATAVPSASEALQLLESERYDAMVSDIAMPGTDGYTLVRELRVIEAARRLPRTLAIALTGFASIADRDEAIAAGFDGHLTKPADPTELANRIAAGCAR